MLKVVNPWLTSTKLTISEGNNYIIKIPTCYIDEAFFDKQSQIAQEEVIEGKSE